MVPTKMSLSIFLPLWMADFISKEKKGLWFLAKSLIWIEYYGEKWREKYKNREKEIIGSSPFLPYLTKNGEIIPFFHHPKELLLPFNNWTNIAQ